MDTVIVVENLRRTYGTTVAVDDISFQVREGEIFGLLGPNGAGKTTSVECLQGLRHPDSGKIRVLGLDPVTEITALRRQIGSQLQEAALPDRIKVWEALDLFTTTASESANCSTLLEQWGLSEKRKAHFGSLSGGQKQRLFVALALVSNPKVVFLDEMTTGLDPAARRVAWDLIRAIRDKGVTVILVTHFMDEAENLCDRLAIVNHGRIVALDSPQGLITTHANQVRVIFTTDKDDLSWLKVVPGVKTINKKGPRVEIGGSGNIVAPVAAELMKHGIVPSDFHLEQPSLEDVFLKITGSAMRE